MKKNEPLVSIIMPTYGRANYIKRAIDSCLNQSYKNIEIVVVDDNEPKSKSRKETEKLMKDNYQKNNKVKYVKVKQNGGACIARNLGFANSKGEYITFLDDDDEFKKVSIEKSVAYILENGYDVIFANLYSYNDDDPSLSYVHRYKKNFELTREGLLRKHLVDIISGGITYLYKRNVLEEIGGWYNIPASQEYILMLNTIVKGYKIGYMDEVVGIAHVHKSEIRITGSLKAIEAKKEVIKLVKPYLKELTFKERRKVKYRLNSFIFINYLRRKDLRCIKYGFKLLPYIDLIIKRKSNNDIIVNGEMWR